MSETAERKTPLYETHLAYKGKMVPFAGYILPVPSSVEVLGIFRSFKSSPLLHSL